MVKKPIISAAEAVAKVRDGDVLMMGGFLACGSPHTLIQALKAQGTKDMTLICNDTAAHDFKSGKINGVGHLVQGRQFKKIIASHIGLNQETQRQMNAGETEVELVPQGTLIERIRAGGFGLGGVLTPTGLGTAAAEGQRTIDIDGRTWLLALPLKADFALVAAEQADYAGNLQYQLTATNFNPIIAMAATTVIAQPREILPVGSLPPDTVKTPGVLVNYLIAREETAP